MKLAPFSYNSLSKLFLLFLFSPFSVHAAAVIYSDDNAGFVADAAGTGTGTQVTVPDPGLTHGDNISSPYNVPIDASSSFNISEIRLPEGNAIPTTVGGYTSTTSQFDYESPAGQGGLTTTNSAWGFDTLGSSSTQQLGFHLDFTASTAPVTSFSFEALDMEVTDTALQVGIAVYSITGALLVSEVFGPSDVGSDPDDNVGLLFGVTVDPGERIGSIVLINGNNDPGTSNDPFAIGGFVAYVAPEPSQGILLFGGFLTIFLQRKRHFFSRVS